MIIVRDNTHEPTEAALLGLGLACDCGCVSPNVGCITLNPGCENCGGSTDDDPTSD